MIVPPSKRTEAPGAGGQGAGEDPTPRPAPGGVADQAQLGMAARADRADRGGDRAHWECQTNPTEGESPMALRINDVAPDFTAETTEGTISFHDWIGDGWALLFSHPKDFTPVCTTELGAVAGLKPEFDKRSCKIIGISVDGVSDHQGWAADIETATGNTVTYPLIGDPQLDVVKLYDMLPADAGDASEGRTAADNATARSVFIIGPDKKIKATLTYPMTTGRNFAEILRLLDSCQLTATAQVATPADWQQGNDVIIVPSVSNEQAAEKYPDGWEAPLPYLRYVKQPG
jgi:alkyl hydroperoxide reductase subunit AhpC